MDYLGSVLFLQHRPIVVRGFVREVLIDQAMFWIRTLSLEPPFGKLFCLQQCLFPSNSLPLSALTEGGVKHNW